MKLSIKKGLFRRKFYNEDQTLVASLKQTNLLAARKIIVDQKGNVQLTTDIIQSKTRSYVILDNHGTIALAYIKDEPKKQTMKETFHVCLPVIHQLELTTPYGSWFILRQSDRVFFICNETQALGRIYLTHTLSVNTFECSEKYDLYFWVAIYAFIEYLINENELNI